MPQVHRTHLKANEAVAGLTARLAKVGILADKVISDYGEDLILQTHLQNVADSFAIRVQVKYSALQFNRKGFYSIQFLVRHLWRWVSHADPIILCIFDRKTGRFLLVDPRTQFSLYQLATTSKKYLTVRLTNKDIATDEYLRQLVWSCRIEHYSVLIARLEQSFLYKGMTRKEEESGRRSAITEIGIVIFAFLRAVEILPNGKFTRDFLASVTNCAVNLSRKYPGANDLNLRAAFMLAVLVHAHRVANVGLLRNLMEHATELCGHYFRYTNAEEWKRLNGHFRHKWHPYGLRNAGKREIRSKASS